MTKNSFYSLPHIKHLTSPIAGRSRRSYPTRNKKRRKKKVKPERFALIVPKKGGTSDREKGTLNYKNITLLRQYLTLQGKILPRVRTRLTARQQRQVATTIKTARVMGFLPFIRQ